MANTYLTRTTWGTPTNKKKFTFSFWFKLSKVDKPDEEVFLTSLTDPYSSTNRLHMSINGSEQLKFEQNDGGYNFHMITNRKFRDPNAWYHACFKVDTTQATQADRFKMYINGVAETSFATEIMPSQNLDVKVPETDRDVFIGSWSGSGQYWDGLLSHFYYTDGYAYDASTFGETDATTGEWKIKTSPSISMGTNGFAILKDGTTITDQSSNSNDFTLGGGTLTKTEDCPSNVFATLNPLQINAGNFTFANGNTKITRSGSWRGIMSTIGVNKGKYYWECKQTGNMALGIGKFGGDIDNYTYLSDTTAWLGDKATAWIYYNNGSSIVKYNNNTSGTYGSVPADGDIISVAFDADNGTIWIGKNGTWENSATESEIEAGTTTNAMYSGITIGADLFGALGAVENGYLEYNFGNGYFGTTAISSEGTNASGIGKFEYDVPDGFTALSTKGLNE